MFFKEFAKALERKGEKLVRTILAWGELINMSTSEGKVQRNGENDPTFSADLARWGSRKKVHKGKTSCSRGGRFPLLSKGGKS